MKIKMLFSYRKGKKNIFSWLISWAAKFEKLEMPYEGRLPSHVGVMIGNFVLEAVGIAGVRIAPYHKWKEKNVEIYSKEIEVPMTYDEVYKRLTKVWDQGYDYIGILYFAIQYIKLMLFGTPLPKTNKWQRKNRFFCTEFVARLFDKDLSMHSPAKVMQECMNDSISDKE